MPAGIHESNLFVPVLELSLHFPYPFRMILTTILLLTTGSFVLQEEGYRSPLFDNWKKNGELQQVKRVDQNGYTLTLWIQKGRYDIAGYMEEKKADAEKFHTDILDVMDWVIRNSAKRLKGPVREFHVVLVKGFVTGGISSTIRGTNVFCAEISKWHERMYSRESRKEILYISAAHEEYHLQNYRTDPGEEKFFRELNAMIWESSVLVRRGGKVDYLWGAMNSNKKQVAKSGTDIDQDFTKKYSATLTRGLACWIANTFYKQGKLEGIEDFAKNLLLDKRKRIESFDALAREAGIKKNGEAITLEDMMEGYRGYLRR